MCVCTSVLGPLLRGVSSNFFYVRKAAKLAFGIDIGSLHHTSDFGCNGLRLCRAGGDVLKSVTQQRSWRHPG
jgi:hypothetical protein